MFLLVVIRPISLLLIIIIISFAIKAEVKPMKDSNIFVLLKNE